MQVVLEAINLCKSYGKDRFQLTDASLTLHRGEIHGLLGPNGAGKTTLIKIMATLLSKDKGTLDVLGYDLDKNPNEIRHFLGYVGQDTERSAYARLTPRENLRFFGALRGLSKDIVDDKIDKYAEDFNFDGILEKQFMHLSGGQKQAVVILRALLHDPPIVFLDEPTKGLDPIAAGNIRIFLKNYAEKEGKSLILTSHILSEVDFLADRVSLINKGRISITDTPLALKQSVGATEFIELVESEIPSSTLQKLNNLNTVLTCTEKEGKKKTWLSFTSMYL